MSDNDQEHDQATQNKDEAMTFTQLFVGIPDRDRDEDGFQYNIPWEPSKCQGCCAWFQRQGAIVKHHKDVHANKFIAFLCQKRQRSFRGPHAALCHYSKCRGIAIIIELHHACEVCNIGFRSLSGLRQHERHLHPEQRLGGLPEEQLQPEDQDGRYLYGVARRLTSPIL